MNALEQVALRCVSTLTADQLAVVAVVVVAVVVVAAAEVAVAVVGVAVAVARTWYVAFPHRSHALAAFFLRSAADGALCESL